MDLSNRYSRQIRRGLSINWDFYLFLRHRNDDRYIPLFLQTTSFLCLTRECLPNTSRFKQATYNKCYELTSA